MLPSGRCALVGAVVLTFAWLGLAPRTEASDPSDAPSAKAVDLTFFEQKIRPVLVKHCYECHSAGSKSLKGHLRVDTRAGLLQGGDSGPAVVPGKVEESVLISALQHDGLEMPPKGKLPDEVIADFEKWVSQGAFDPRQDSAESANIKAPLKGMSLEAGRRFWAFRTPHHHEPPNVADDSWPRSDLDRFILAALEARGVKPAPDADRRTLIRRVTVDLTGLLPTPEEVEAFLADTNPEAFAKLVDRLLASPRFGERWGRHWLDQARYADSNGKDENLTFHDAWRYRDYVIDAFNRDVPFDRFLQEQLAGDLLPAATQEERDRLLVATGFLVVGPKVLADRDTVKRRMDVIDEQVDTVGKVTMALTVGCARCHDHKFDAIPQADYYAIAGIFGSTKTLDGFKLNNPVVSGWTRRPLGADGERKAEAVKAHEAELKKVADAIKKAKTTLKTREDKASMRSPAKLVGIVVDDADPGVRKVGDWKPSVFTKPYVGAGYLTDDKAGKGTKSIAFTADLPKGGEYEVLIGYTPGANRSTRTPVTIGYADGAVEVKVDQTVRPKIDGLFVAVGTYRFEAGSKAEVVVSNDGTNDGYVIADAVRFVPKGALENDPEMAMGVPGDVRKALEDARKELETLEAREKALKARAPEAPSMALAVRDEDKPADLKINVRGNVHSLGAEVPRGFLQAATSGPMPTLPSDRSGRLELARWLTDPSHPLTARVAVNRVWAHLMGEGIVRTLDDFGVQGETPSHPGLLDELAVRFRNDDWSVKRLIRSIVLSRTYQLSVKADPALVQADPENRLRGRASRRRVEGEVIRDAILQVADRLDLAMGGSMVASLGERAIDNDSKGGLPTDALRRRSVYLPIIRNDVPAILELFDFADPDVTVARREATTVPTQALYLMNSPFVAEQARHAAQRLLRERSDNRTRVERLYRLAFGRSPTAEESERALDYLASRCREGGPDADVEAWTDVCQAVFGSTEFRFVE